MQVSLRSTGSCVGLMALEHFFVQCLLYLAQSFLDICGGISNVQLFLLGVWVCLVVCLGFCLGLVGLFGVFCLSLSGMSLLFVKAENLFR